ncbi:MAG: hypothetical protein QOF35_2075, partial [Actinomycetota bacterium]|nr:hypothetical protein [Actinomycetota bacterium]
RVEVGLTCGHETFSSPVGIYLRLQIL